MSASITLSAGVRQNLLSLQQTGSMMATTQNRLATGKKVNSALDNPTNFFTASSLTSRSSDLGSLLDSMSNGVKVLEAADNGLSAITKTVESMQSTLRQARQDKSNQSVSYAMGTVDTSSVKNLSFSGGAVGATAVDIALNTAGVAAVASTVTASADYVAPTAASGPLATTGVNFAPLSVNDGNETYAFTVSKNGGPAVNVQLATADGSIGSIWAPEAVTGINADLAAGGSTIRVRTVNGWNNLQFYDTDLANTGTAATITVSDITKGGTTPTGTLGWEGSTLSGQGADAGPNKVVTISDGTTTATATLTAANAATAAAARGVIQAAIDATALVGTATVGGSGNRIDLAGLADGSNSLSVAGANVNDVFGAARTVTPGSIASGTGAVFSVDALVSSINGNGGLAGKVRASNDNGRLRIENQSTAALSVGGISASTGTIDGSAGTATVGGNDVRKNLVSQFNQFRDQLDKLADDASFNGINLLRGDKLKITFNETGASSIDIQAKDADGDVRAINATNLGVTTAAGAEFDADSDIDARLDVLTTALNTLRSQASSFGSNLSIVQNRQDFTKAMMTTLQTGADSLTLADTNEEGANMLALQTRQQLSTTALSMANQANQAVLRLF
jgi:flagellin-like hook-associated protein FlgL